MLKFNFCALGALLMTSIAYSDEPRVIVGEGGDEFKTQIFNTFQVDQGLAAYEGFPTEGFEVDDFKVGLASETPLVLIEQFQTAPARSLINERMKFLSGRESPATYLLFVEDVSDFDWTSGLEVPSNVKFTFSSRTAEIDDLKAYYQAVGLQFDPENVQINYPNAVRMAASQLWNKSTIADSYTLKPWKSGKSYYGLLDGGVIVDGWHSNQADTKNYPSISAQWLADNDVVWSSGNTQPALRDAVMALVSDKKCTTSWKWKGSEIHNVDLQAFGVPNF